MVPRRLFFTRGVGIHADRLPSRALALAEAGLGAQNLVRVESVFPPRAGLIQRQEGLGFLAEGEVTFAVLAENATDEPRRLITAAIGLALPVDEGIAGYLSAYHGFGEAEEQAGARAEELAASMLAASWGVAFDPAESWDGKKELYRIGDETVRTAHMAQTAAGDSRGRWTTTVAAAVLLFD